MKHKMDSKKIEKTLAAFEGLDFTIEGLALVYGTGGTAVLRCPIVEDHKLVITIKSPTRAGDFLVSQISIPVGAKVEIKNNNTMSPSPSTFGTVFNIAELHSTNKIKFIRDLDKLSSLFEIGGIELFPSDEPKHKDIFQTWEIRNHGQINEARQREEDKINIISVVKGKVKFKNFITASTNIIITYPQTQMQIDLSYVGGIKHSINISNLCNEVNETCLDKSDFMEYYEIIDSMAFSKKFDFVRKSKSGNRAPCNVIYCDPEPESQP